MKSESLQTPPRRGSITQGYIPTADIIRKSISRSWTISNPEDDQQINSKNGIDPRIHVPTLGSSIHHQETNSYPNLIRLNKSPYNSNMDFNADSYERTPPTQRRVLRQSTLPNPDSSYPSNSLKIPVSPKQQVSPQYSPYHTDNENEPENDAPQPPSIRYQIRRQSTLPCKPNEHHTSKYLSTSPNRSYSRSPDPSSLDGEHSTRYPPFVRQSTFPSNNGAEQFHQRQLPTSPNRLSYSKSPDSGGENGQVSPRRFTRQTTLPNPDQHIKLLPTSPPKKSPQYMKRSPEFQRQHTISNPEGMSTLSVHQHGPKFLPISPRQKQSFLFPQPSAPRTFLSQQHFPTMNEDQPPPTNHPIREHSKMIKVRSHSNEEYSFNKSHVPPPTEGRRLLPEIPNRSRSPSRLVRQDHVKDENGEKRSPILKTFAEAKQALVEEYDGQMYETQYTTEYCELNSTFAEADENNYNEQESYNAYEQSMQMDQSSSGLLYYAAEQTTQFHEPDVRRYDSVRNKITSSVKSAESYMNDSSSDYYTPDEYIRQAQKNRNRRRKSRELPADPEVVITLPVDESRKHKPETMRSVSEDSSPRTMKIVPRRSFSQPEKETQKKPEPSKIPSPKPLGEKTKPTSPVKVEADTGPRKPVYKFPKMLEMRGDSKSFDAVVRQLIKTDDGKDADDKSQSMDDNLFSEKKEHKTTLNEAEIQNAVEQAAGLFKKVVLQRRKERKPADEGDMAGRREDVSESELKYSTDVEDYKLVFISSDSSGKEDDYDDSSSTTSSIATKCSIILDECDWDYFEPSAQNAKSLLKDFTSSTFSPFGSPSLYRRRFNPSPASSPLFYRRGQSESPLSIRKSDEEILNSSSPTSSEGFLPEYLKAWKQNHKCKDVSHACKCGQSPHYVAIPVPILVPMDEFRNWNSSGNNSDLLQLWNSSSNLLLNQHEANVDVIDAQHSDDLVKTLPDGEEKEKKKQKISDLSITSNNVSLCSSVFPSRRISRSLSLDSDSFDNERDNSGAHLIHKSSDLKARKSELRSTTHLSETIKITSKHETNTCGSVVSVGSPYTSDNLIKTTASCNPNAIQATSHSGTMISVGKLKAPESGASDGHLVSESVFSSADEESDEEKSVQRSYDVAGASLVASDVESTSSNREEETSGTDVTDSEDTGVDDLRSKSKRFTKVFVVNRNAPTSESDSCSSINVVESSSDDETSSDNDTDTDGITLNYMKLLEQEENNPSSQSSQEVVVLNSIKPIDEDINESVILSSIKTIDNDFDDITNAYSEKVNENVCVDKNKSKSPSISDDDSKLTNVSEKIKTNEQTSICEDKQSITCDSSAKTSQTELDANSNETLTDGDDDEFQVDSMDFIQEKKTSSCNLSMILNERTLHDDVSSAADENLLEIESPLNGDVDDKREQQTLIVNNDNVPAKETGLHQHITTNDVLPLLNDQSATSAGNNNTINISCVKQSVNEEKAQEQTASVSSQRSNQADGNGKFTSLIMITQDQDEDNFAMKSSSNVNVVSSDTTQIVTANSSRDAIVVQHRNWQPRYPTNVTNGASVKSKIGFYEENINKNSNSKAKVEPSSSDENKSKADEVLIEKSEDSMANKSENDDVKVITSNDTLSAVVCMEDGLADDDSWVEDISQQDSEEFASSDFDSSDEMTLTANDREEELRGYNRVSIDFTLHTIVEESCEESEYEAGDRKSQRMSASELEKYFFFGLGDGNAHSSPAKTQDDSPSETSSVCSEGLDSLNGPDETTKTGDETLASSRLEKYFLSGFMGFSADGADGSDGSGSVGSDSEGRPSPEQRRKKLVRARGTGRSHSSSLDNLLSKEESSLDNQNDLNQQESGDSSETDTCDDPTEKTENHSDTVKRKKKCKKLDTDDSRKIPDVEVKDPSESENDEDGRKTPQPEFLMPASSNLVQSRKQHSRDSGFIGSNDDLLKSDGQKSPDMKVELEEIQEEMKESEPTVSDKTPALKTNLMRKDSFNAWSSDEETNLMMSKMRQFFKSLVAASANSRNPKSSTSTEATSAGVQKARQRPPQLVYFENELTRLMKTVPGIKEEQVRELVEYFSSEDTWSDSYDSSDYTSSDKESAVRKSTKIQQQISASCQEIIQKFDKGKAVIPDEEGDMGDGGLLDDGLNKETAFVYQKLVASITKIADEKPVVAPIETANSPPIIAKVMHHIGSRLVALMHEVSSGESLKSNSPKQATRYHRRLQAKISATTTEDDDSESNFEDPLTHNLPRSKSHDLLLGDAKPTPDAMTGEEREASDYERFSWRGSFESALLTNCDSRNKLSTLDNSSSALSILAAKRRSAGDLLFTPKSLSREQLDRVRSCGSIGGAGEHDLENSKLWESTQSQESTRRRSGIIEDDTDESSDNEHHLHARTTLPRSIQTSSIVASTTNSLPRLPTTSSNTQTTSGAMQKAQSVYQFLQNNVKSARYRAPGFNRQQQAPKRALSAPGLQPLVPRRDRRNKVHSLAMEETHLSDNASSPVIGNRNVAATALVPSSAASHPASPASTTTDPWPSQSDEDIDRLVAMHQNRHNSLSSLGLRSDSMASVYSGAGEGRYGTVQVKGSVEFGMQYNYKQGALEIHVKQCKELAAVDLKRNRSDPYVKVYLLPDKTKSGKRKTKVKKHTLNPVFDEVLRFYMSLSSLESRTLWLTVWHSDMFGRNDFLGEVMISLQNKVFDNPQPQWYPLEERSEPFEDVTTYRGDIIVGLKFIPGSDSSGSSHSHGLSLRKFSIKSNSSATSANNGSPTGPISCSKNTKGSLHIMVKEAKHLSAVKANGNCDAFCKSYLLPDKNRSSKQKTPVAKRTTSPQWNYTFVYEDVTLAELSERALELTIWDHDRLASNEFLGGVRFSLGTGKHYGRIAEWNDANGKELTLWQSMINRPNFWVEGCLALRSTLEHRLCS